MIKKSYKLIRFAVGIPPGIKKQNNEYNPCSRDLSNQIIKTKQMAYGLTPYHGRCIVYRNLHHVHPANPDIRILKTYSGDGFPDF